MKTTATITSIAPPAFTHTADCRAQRYGRAVLHLIGAWDRHAFTVSEIEAAVRTLPYRCQCADLRLHAIEGELSRLRKAVRHAERLYAGFGSGVATVGNRNRIAELVTERAAIKAAVNA